MAVWGVCRITESGNIIYTAIILNFNENFKLAASIGNIGSEVRNILAAHPVEIGNMKI